VVNKSSQKVKAFLDEVFDDVFAREASKQRRVEQIVNLTNRRHETTPGRCAASCACANARARLRQAEPKARDWLTALDDFRSWLIREAS